jgi:mono/diheme cytochrome c family protein
MISTFLFRVLKIFIGHLFLLFCKINTIQNMRNSNCLFVVLAIILLTIVTSCDKDIFGLSESNYNRASASRGGIMYDTFWATEAGFNKNSAYLNALKTNPDFFRCKQCHGWDLKGTLQSYNNRAPKTTRPNVASFDLFTYAKSKTAQEIFDGMKKTTDRRSFAYDLATYNPTTNATIGDQMPNYTQVLSDKDMWDLVKFMVEEATDVTQLYDATYTGTYPKGTAIYSNHGKDGDAAKGAAYFATNCVSCHGEDGKKIVLEGLSLGKFSRSKPNEVHHKIKYGQLGSTMIGRFDISLSEMKDLYKFLADTNKFPD